MDWLYTENRTHERKMIRRRRWASFKLNFLYPALSCAIGIYVALRLTGHL